jgi:tetratricopeptide (TPR) repeat protein
MSLSLGLISLLAFFAAGPEGPAAGDLSRLQAEKNLGLAALEEGNVAEARKRFETVRKLAPEEPLGWADGAVAAMRGKDLAEAQKLLAEALRLSPKDALVLALEAQRLELTGNAPVALDAYERAASANPKDLASRWSSARLAAAAGARPRAVRNVEAALEQSPANLYLLARLCEYRRDEGNRAAALADCDRMTNAIEAKDAKLAKYVDEARSTLQSGDAAAASLKYRVVENLLRATPRYQQTRHDVEPGVVGMPLEDWTPPMAARLRARSAAIPVRFVEKPLSGLAGAKGLAAVRAAGREGRDLVFAGQSGIFVAPARDGYKAGAPLPGSAARSVEVADVTNSGDLDLVSPGALWVSGKGGYRKTPIAEGERVLPIDYDNDGDLDLYVSGGRSGGDRLLRNNLDGTWTDVTKTALPAGTASPWAAAADFDRDGDTDLVLVSSGGGLRLLDNLRGGRMAEKAAGLPTSGSFLAVAAGDLNADGRPDLVWTSEDRTWVALNRGDGTFLPASELPAGGVPLLFDFDNDGHLDLFLAGAKGSALFRNDGAGGFAKVEAAFPPALDADAVDFDGDGDLDLVLITASGTAALFENQGGNAAGWLDVALEGLPTGSAKVNRFGYGSEVEIKAGQLYALRTVSRPVTHFGLGQARKADVLRVVWTNGIPQNALSPPVRTLVKEVQQLKGSCPFVYAFDGVGWNFVTDALGRSPAGLLYDGVHLAPADTREWLVVPGEKLKPSSGRLLVDFTEELWETAYFDYAELRAVDHPAGVEVVAEEKMVPHPFPEKRLLAVSRPFVPHALDGRGRDRTREIARADGVYLRDFSPTRFQGIVSPHELILELPEARRGGRVMLYLTGWIFYSDTSINVSLSQGGLPKPFGPVLEVPDRQGRWKVAIPAMGYPAGKTKTMPVDLSDVLDRRDPRIRLRTNLEIAWDRISYTVDDEPAPLRITPVPLLSADLFFRGFSRMTRESDGGPQVFVHDEVETAPRWADMAGLYTRLGPVRELLAAADDRYVIMKGGDAVRLAFDASALPPLAPGWERDYVLVLDGWDKDADKNTVAAQTVEPLPFHGMDDSRYGDPSQQYPDDPSRLRFRQEYLTRRGGPEEFIDALRAGTVIRKSGIEGERPKPSR